MHNVLSVTPSQNSRRQVQSMIRKASWLLDQALLLIQQNPEELDPTNTFARHLGDVQRHLVATSQGFFKTKDTDDKGHHDEHRTSTAGVAE